MARKNVMEEIKAQKDGLDIWQDIEGWAKTGYDTVNPEWWDLFKWYGLYRQRPNDGYFMLRIKIAGGLLTAEQAIEIGRLTNQYARGFGDITTRQNIQLHWVTIENAPEIVERLARVGLTSMGACGDITRNIVGCPVAGLDPQEYHDCTPELLETHRRLLGNRAYSNLPRKFKISISGCHLFCAQPQINDIGLSAFRLPDGRTAYNLIVGGGLSTAPMLAQPLGVIVPPEKAADVCEAIVGLFRDEGYREKRNRARMKFLVKDWGAEKFRDTLESRLGYELERYDGPVPMPQEANEDHMGVTAQKNGKYYVGCAVTRGRIKGDQLIRAGELAQEYGDGGIRNTNRQNLVFANVQPDKVPSLQSALKSIGLDPGLSFYRRQVISCTGIQFCNLSVTETKEFARELVEHLEKKFENGAGVRINISGCPNACSQYQIGDIGLQGSYAKLDGEKVHGYWVTIGGSLGRDAAFGRVLAKGVPQVKTTEFIEGLIRFYRDERNDGETFQEFCTRKTDEELLAVTGWQSDKSAAVEEEPE